MLDAPGVNVLLGGGSVDTNPNAGFKITGAYRIDSRLGVELTGFYIPTRTTSSSVSSTGQPGSIDLFLPFFDVTINQENVTEISYWPDVSRQRAGNAVEQPRRRRVQRDMGDAAAGRMASRPPRRASASCSCASRTRSPPAAPTTRPTPATSGTPPTRSTRATASTACRSARARRTTRARGSAA